MAKLARLQIDDGDVAGAIRGFLAGLLEGPSVGAVMAPRAVPSADNVVQTLITEPEELSGIDVLAPVMPINAARAVSRLTRIAPMDRPVAVVMRPCEIRALVELTKLKQADLENLIIIGFDCYGAQHLRAYAAAKRDGGGSTEEFLNRVSSDLLHESLRSACRVCERPAPETGDLVIGLFGADLNKELLLIATTEKGEALIDGLAAPEEGSDERRREALGEIMAAREKARDEMFASIEGEATGLEGLLAMLAPCINCHNCMTVCPICYCMHCFFDSDTFDLEGWKYLRRAARKGAYRMLPDTVLFHLGRLNHMASSCVACGACEDACPNDIPLLALFKTVGHRVQEAFEYVAGRDLDEPLPLATFREDELEPR
ncbi:hypothetical protein AMJ39_06840 [candidate division TA06 bacterium DG_24]|uniref:4Fe-4S ferredoxin-type domain-containing protein n=3 Tax=Bacteria division TA06 TaxID=1156500 RepID=A0A0S8JHY5_UNCT6|nr:MAG: hypothetical protein AMJ39_06840 [candidate division TA06 bacterium DG_24]KPK68547.1 MAG: hypothetical protein AMJ82_07990 [candidate division TA06 bacterium SM23_40]KPL09168.1 MAG: hypothetical protein AMJ71_07135 [candidate division TA06 bacterium SM1_40]